jgi:nitrite reductase/ring-hydroxylating ferredoxin subunit
MADHIVAEEGEIEDGEHILVELEGRFIGIYKIDGEYHAYTDWCPHQSGPICEGGVGGTTEISFDRDTLEYGVEGQREWVKEGEILRCPWHAWEFDIITGEARHDDEISLISHSVNVEDGDIVVSL